MSFIIYPVVRSVVEENNPKMVCICEAHCWCGVENEPEKNDQIMKFYLWTKQKAASLMAVTDSWVINWYVIWTNTIIFFIHSFSHFRLFKVLVRVDDALKMKTRSQSLFAHKIYLLLCINQKTVWVGLWGSPNMST